MSIAKRIFLFILVNFLVIFMVSIILSILNVKPFLTSQGLNYYSLMIFCLIWGMVGALISLSLSRIVAKKMMKIKIISSNSSHTEEKKLYKMVEKLSKDAGLDNIPEVGIFSSPEVNAFATGPTKKRSLVAVSTGLLHKLESNEVEAVIAHEISHITNGDMVTMTLLQGVINAFVMFLARVLAYAVSTMGKNRNRSPSFISYYLFTILFEIFFMILGTIVIAAYSRYREYRADAGGARLAGKTNMIDALKALKSLKSIQDPKLKSSNYQAFKISNPNKFLHLFSTHPPLEKRIERLQKGY